MRKTVGFVLLALGAALLAVGVVTTTWAPGVVKKTPLDVNTTTRLEGEAARLGDAARPIKIFSLSRTDSEASDDNNVVFVAVQCVVYTDEGDVPDCGDNSEAVDQVAGETEGGDPRVLTISVDKFVTDRVTAEAVGEEGYIPDADRGAQREGLVNKWPFDSEKKTYQYWDSLTAQSWPAEYVEETDFDGLNTYHYRVAISADDAEVIPDETGGYENTIDIYVVPETGAIVQQTQDQTRTLNGETILTLKAGFSEDQVTTSVSDGKADRAKLLLITRTMPLVGFIGGLLLLLLGAAVTLTGRRKDDDADIVRPRREHAAV